MRERGAHFKDVVRGLPDTKFLETGGGVGEGGGPGGGDARGEDGGEVFGGGDQGGELGRLDIEVGAGDAGEDGGVYEVVELRKGQQAAGGRRGPGKGDVENVVVAVAEGVVALAVDGLVGGGRQQRRVKAVGGGEAVAAGEADECHAGRSE